MGILWGEIANPYFRAFKKKGEELSRLSALNPVENGRVFFSVGKKHGGAQE